MKKIVFFIGTLTFGGAERVLSILSNSFAKNDYDVTILTYYDQDICYEIDKKIKIVCVENKVKEGNILNKILWIRKFVGNNFDIAFSFLSPFNMLFIASTLFMKIPVIVADRNDPRCIPNKTILRFIRNILYCFANNVIVQTKRNKEYFCKFIQKKSIVIPNPISPSLQKGIAIASKKEKVIVTVGRLMEQKNHEMLINAFSKILTEYPDYKLHIYGEGPLEDKLNALIIRLNLEDKAILKGTSSTIFEDIKLAQIFALSSNFEGMPNVLIEAMCLGIPVVSTKVSGATDFVVNGENGLLINVGQEQELVDAFSLLIGDEELRNKCAHNASDIYEQLQEKIILEQWIKVLRDFF